jgi:aryl-alcohol dehydrogenase-like predicted oxidoreductase
MTPMTSRERRYRLGPVTVSRHRLRLHAAARSGVFGPPRDRGEAIAVLRRAAELGVDHIDTAQFYGPDVGNELIRAALGLSNITREHLLHAIAIADIACIQNPMNLADRHFLPVLEECEARGIAFLPFFPLGSAFACGNPVLRSPQVASIAARPRPHSGSDSPGVAAELPAEHPADPRHVISV